MAIQLTRSFRRNKINLSIDQQIMFLDKLALLLDQGYSIVDALTILKVNRQWEQTIDSLIEKLQSGLTFDQALVDLQFDSQIVSFIYFALQHGNLTEAMQQSVRFINQQIKLFNQFKQVIRYPIVLLSFFLIVLFAINLYVYPAFLQLYSTQSQPASILLIAIQLVDVIFIGLYALIIISVLSLILITIIKHRLTIEQKVNLAHFVRLPRFFIKKYCSLMFATHFSSLLEAELPFKSCLTLIVEHKKDSFLSYYCQAILTDLNNGLSLDDSLKKHDYFEANLNALFMTKANHSLIKRDLRTYATLSLDQIRVTTYKVINYIQPTIFIIIAISVVFIYLSILLPMLQLIQTI